MATVSGTATNFLDLYNKLRDFLTTDATLVGLSQNWTQIAGNTGTLAATDEIVLQGPGLAGADEILVGMKPFVSVSSDYYNLALYGLTTYNPANGIATGQVNQTGPRMLHAWDQPIPYWFVASGRRFIVILRISTVYQCAYAGFGLPFVLPTLWPYPLFVGGCSNNSTWRYSQATVNMSAFFDPGSTSASLLFPDVIWRGVINRYDGGSNNAVVSDDVNVQPFHTENSPMRDNLDGSYNLDQVTVDCTVPYQAQLMALEGVFRVSGFGNAAENTISYGGKTYLVVPNVFRNTWDDFAAILLE